MDGSRIRNKTVLFLFENGVMWTGPQTTTAIWSTGNFWRLLFLEPRACNAWNHTNQNNSAIFKVPIFKNIH